MKIFNAGKDAGKKAHTLLNRGGIAVCYLKGKLTICIQSYEWQFYF